MAIEDELAAPATSRTGILPKILLGVAVVYVVVSLYLIFDLRARVEAVEGTEKVTAEKLEERINSSAREWKSSTRSISDAQHDLEDRMNASTSALAQQQHAAEKRLSTEQKEGLNQVTGEVASVKTDLGSAKSDLASTKSDLENTKAKLERVMGDQGVLSGLVAHTRDDLEELKHRGDRNYYDFTLRKGAGSKPVSTVSLQLKKTDAKKNRFTLEVIADDRTIEKKDRTVAEPMQFYTGRDKQLYEVVVFTVAKDQITGYLSTPKSVPAPPTP
jgi:hypothetical protein